MTTTGHINALSPAITPSRRPDRRGRTTADDLLRLTPRGVRTAIEPLARGERTIEQLPDYALKWLAKHGAIEPAKKTPWRQTNLGRNYLKRVAGLGR